MKKIKILSAVIFLAVFVSPFTHAQEKPSSMLKMGAKPAEQGPAKPTEITSDSMTVDIGKNMAVFSGNVIVDGDQMKISCNKMIIYLEDKDPATVAAAGPAKPEDKEMKNMAAGMGLDSSGGSKELSRIICLGNVIILRKIYDEVEKLKGEQKSVSGKADYDVKSGKIVLSEDKPVVYRGYDELRARKITIWRDSERVDAEGGTTILINQDSGAVDKDKDKKPDSEAPEKPLDNKEKNNDKK